MKFWEALREMEKGAVCERDWMSRGRWQRTRLHGSFLEVDSDDGFEPADLEVCLNSGWRIVAPAPTKAEPLAVNSLWALTMDRWRDEANEKLAALAKRVEALEERIESLERLREIEREAQQAREWEIHE